MRNRILLFSLMLVFSSPVCCGFLFSKSVGKLKSDTAGVSMKLEGPWWSKVDIGPEANAKELTAGIYKPKSLSRVLVQKATDKEKPTKSEPRWTLISYGPWGKLSRIKVEKNKTTVLKFSGPLQVKTDTKKNPQRGNSGRVVSIGMQLVGEYGEVYNLRVRKGRQIVKAPSFKILAEDGKELSAGKFEYG